MGRLIDGVWTKRSIISSGKKGDYQRIPRSFRDTISYDHPKFQPESGRYHLYVSYACPWAHRCLIYLKIKGLEEHISVDVVHPDLLEDGWTFDSSTNAHGATGDRANHKKFLYEIYQAADPKVSTSVTVPVLWDKKLNTIVNNESSEIIRIFNTQFNELTGNSLDLCPQEHLAEIDRINEIIYHNVNNGVYKSGFAKTQEAYDEAVSALFETLDYLESFLEGKDYLVGHQISEADIRLITTLLRFDKIYHTHFKCNLKKISEYSNLNSYLNRFLAFDYIKETTHMDHIKRHYYYSHGEINPFRIIPIA